MRHGRRTFIALILIGSGWLSLTGCRAEAVRPQAPRTLRILTYNIHHGEAMDRQFDYERLANVINDLSPDIVALQEVDNGTDRASGVDQAALLGRLCKMHHAFGQAMPYQNGQYGEAVLSRFPIKRAVVHPLPYRVGQEPRATLEVRIEPEGLGPMVFAGTHLCHQSNETRTQQAQRISQLFARQGGSPVILAGDFNARPASGPMSVLLKDGWIDVVAPRSRIDYILIRPSDPWQVKEVTIVDEPVVSDHDPILAVLEWPGEK
jgi:endonuclease/exonuclease/phosphatase family metal-dependent hydrolase